jgi:hypothetical protein
MKVQIPTQAGRTGMQMQWYVILETAQYFFVKSHTANLSLRLANG